MENNKHYVVSLLTFALAFLTFVVAVIILLIVKEPSQPRVVVVPAPEVVSVSPSAGLKFAPTVVPKATVSAVLKKTLAK